MMPISTCQYCGWNGPADQCGRLENAWERVEPGDPMPAGECPACNASALLDETRHEPCIKVLTTQVPERATKFGVRSTAQSLANVMWHYSQPWSYRVQDLNRSGFRVAVHRDTPGAGPDPHGYLRIERT